VARAVTTAAATSGDAAAPFAAYNVGSGTVRTIGDLATELALAYGGPEPVVTGEFRLGDVRHITASSERIKTKLGWAAEYDLTAGIANLLRQT
jgi:dTDP-L-rhamnose 4-epimerase